MVAKRIFLPVVCGCLVLALAGAACAQWADTDRNRLGLGYGFFMPTNSNVKRATGSVWSGPVGSYTLSFDEQDRPSSLVTIGYYTKGGSIDEWDGSLFALTGSMIKHLSPRDSSFYVGGGIGGYFGRFTANPGNYFAEGGYSIDKIGLHVLGGWDYKQWAFAELRYDLTTRTSDQFSFSGLSLNAGMHVSF